MARRFKRVDYEQSRQQTVTIGECMPPNHLAYFIVAMVMRLDLSCIYAQYALVDGEAFAPEILLGLLLYGYGTGVFSSRKIEKGTYETIPFRYIAGGLHPDHDPIANLSEELSAAGDELVWASVGEGPGSGGVELGPHQSGREQDSHRCLQE